MTLPTKKQAHKSVLELALMALFFALMALFLMAHFFQLVSSVRS